jgi:hypothetical protein
VFTAVNDVYEYSLYVTKGTNGFITDCVIAGDRLGLPLLTAGGSYTIPTALGGIYSDVTLVIFEGHSRRRPSSPFATRPMIGIVTLSSRCATGCEVPWLQNRNVPVKEIGLSDNGYLRPLHVILSEQPSSGGYRFVLEGTPRGNI